MPKKIGIIGAGISGIYLGNRLKKEGFSIKILEANNRIGGRIYTKETHETKVELGATWLWKYNTELIKLCKELKISLFEQNMQGDALFQASKNTVPQRFQIPKNQEISYRIVGGTATIINKLKADFKEDEMLLNEKVLEISEAEKAIKINTEKNEFFADFVISTIPPQLLVNNVKILSKIDENILQIANKTHTWMHDSIKFAIVYATPFWKEKGLSGVGFSNVGPFTEVYDHTDFENKKFALVGFLDRNLANETTEFREEKVKEQLHAFFGDEGKKHLSYEEKVWSKEPFLNVENNQFLTPHFNNGNPMYQQEFLNGKLIIAGSETSSKYGGYMEGAIFRGNEITAKLVQKFK